MFEPREGDIDSVTASTAVIFSPSSGSLVENEYSGGYLVVSGKVYQIVSHDSDGILVLATSITATLGPAVIYKAAPAANTVTGQSAPANPSAIAVAGVGAPSTPSAIQQVAQAAPDVPSAFVLPDEQPPSAPQVGPSTPVVITHTVQLTDDENYRVMVTSRSAPVTVALPDPGGLNQDIEVIDASMQANVHAITIDPGTRTIEGQASLVLTYSGAAVKLTYTGTAWKITS